MLQFSEAVCAVIDRYLASSRKLSGLTESPYYVPDASTRGMYLKKVKDKYRDAQLPIHRGLGASLLRLV